MSYRHPLAVFMCLGLVVFLLSVREVRTTFAAVFFNASPVAVDDYRTVHNQLLISPMTNDYDPDVGDSISFNGIVTQPQHGTLFIYTTGTYTYRADYAYTGSDSFTYSIKDTTNNVATATVYITVVNQPPVAVNDSYTVHGQLLIGSGNNDYDPEGDGLQFVGFGTPQHGTLSYYNQNQSTYHPTYGYVGPDTFTYQIKDGLGLYATGTISINNVIRPRAAS